MTSIINTGAGAANISIHDLYLSSLPLVDQVIDVIGDGEIYSVYLSGGTAVDIGIRVAGGPWRIHDNRIRAGDTGIHVVAAAGTRNIISNNYVWGGFNNEGILVESDDNIINGNVVDGGTIRITGDDNLITNNVFRSFDSADNGFIIAGDRNLIVGNKVVDVFATSPAVGLQILSGATDNIVGINDLVQATTPITDAGTGTIYKAVREAVWVVSGTLTAGTGVDPRRINEDVFIIDAAIVVDTAPTDASLIVDVHLNGTTIFTTQGNRPTILATATDSGLAVPDVTVATGGDVLTVDIDQIGSTVAGADLAVFVRYVNTGTTG